MVDSICTHKATLACFCNGLSTSTPSLCSFLSSLRIKLYTYRTRLSLPLEAAGASSHTWPVGRRPFCGQNCSFFGRPMVNLGDYGVIFSPGHISIRRPGMLPSLFLVVPIHISRAVTGWDETPQTLKRSWRRQCKTHEPAARDPCCLNFIRFGPIRRC